MRPLWLSHQQAWPCNAPWNDSKFLPSESFDYCRKGERRGRGWLEDQTWCSSRFTHFFHHQCLSENTSSAFNRCLDINTNWNITEANLPYFSSKLVSWRNGGRGKRRVSTHHSFCHFLVPFEICEKKGNCKKKISQITANLNHCIFCHVMLICKLWFLSLFI